MRLDDVDQVATILSPEMKTSFGSGLIQLIPEEGSSSSAFAAYAEHAPSNTDTATLGRRSNGGLGLGLLMFVSSELGGLCGRLWWSKRGFERPTLP